MRRSRRLLIAVTVLTLAGCSGRAASTADSSPSASASSASQADFGTLKNVCGSGTPKAVTGTGVTTADIKVGVFTDLGFTKNPEFVNAAKVFTSWCNDAGGINGRKLVPVTHDSKLFQVAQQMLVACKSDFALVGGGSALDSLGTKDRLKCLLPDFPAQVVQIPNVGSDLQAYPLGPALGYAPYAGYYSWLTKEKYPSSASSVGIISGDSPAITATRAEGKETLAALGAKISYDDLYPAAGVSDWTPYAQKIKSKKVKGLIFNGSFSELAKLEQVLTSIGYKPDWIDANSNAYGPAFLQLAAGSLASQNNYAALPAVYPVEEAADNPATEQVVKLYAKYAPDAQVTLPAVQAFSAWLLFAESARSCSELTRKCVLDSAAKQTAWTAGGLQAPADLSSNTSPRTCFNVVQATAKGWTVADFKPDNGAYRCNIAAYKFKASYGKPLTLADVGKTIADLK